ncbi:Protein of unknown function, partial [Gryllus bimaculatus]
MEDRNVEYAALKLHLRSDVPVFLHQRVLFIPVASAVMNRIGLGIQCNIVCNNVIFRDNDTPNYVLIYH